MRKLTVKLSLNQEMKELIRPFMEYVESYKMLEIIRLDFEKGVKVVMVSLKLREGNGIENIELPEFLEILSILKSEGDEHTVLLKVDVIDKYMDIMREYNTQSTSDLIWDTPFYMDGEKVVMSCIGKEEELKNFIEILKKIGAVEQIKFTKATYESKDLLSQLTEKQREVLQLAKKKGYFDYPRDVTIGDLSKILKLSKSTTAEHLRKAEKRLMSQILSEF